MQQPPPGQARRLVGGLAHLGVGEIVGRCSPGLELADQATPHELLHGGDRLVFRTAAGALHDPEIEGAADDGSRGQDLGGGFADGCEPLAEQCSDAPAGPFRTFGSGCDGFDEVERQALRLCQERVHVEPSRA